MRGERRKKRHDTWWGSRPEVLAFKKPKNQEKGYAKAQLKRLGGRRPIKEKLGTTGNKGTAHGPPTAHQTVIKKEY